MEARHELWVGEFQTDHLRLSFRVKDCLYCGSSEYQSIMVVDTYQYGRMLFLDNCVMLSEKDEFVYHETIVHPALLSLGDPKRVLIIGGGDGGTAREVLKHRSVEQIDQVEIDGKVVEVSKKYFPALSASFDDPRVNLMIGDGVDYVKTTDKQYDVIIIDSTDPVKFAKPLFDRVFYEHCDRILTERGIVISQIGDFYTTLNYVADKLNILRDIFKHALVLRADIPVYPTGNWLFVMGSKCIDPRENVPDFPDTFNLKYLNKDMYRALFAIPNFARNVLEL